MAVKRLQLIEISQVPANVSSAGYIQTCGATPVTLGVRIYKLTSVPHAEKSNIGSMLPIRMIHPW